MSARVTADGRAERQAEVRHCLTVYTSQMLGSFTIWAAFVDAMA